ncbi:MAG: PadR family transcriptional regulator [Clostridia bacterium]|nr:MAG: PadR family transcriptional regulator [Clostridia bacterium]
MLTARQKQFLQAVAYLDTDHEGVHYSDVAKLLAVSKWTAYDVLNAMASNGYLVVEREARGSEPAVGRSRVLFKLSPAGKEALAQKTWEWEEVWEGAKTKLRHFIEESRQRGTGEIIHQIMIEIGNVHNPLIFCAYLMVISLLAYRAVTQGNSGESVLLGNLVSLLLAPKSSLVVFASCLLALSLNHHASGEIGTDWLGYLPAYEEKARKLDPSAQEALRSFAVDTVARLWPQEADVAGSNPS